ncbi:DNA repair protein [Hyaloscypha hepaticicola]|uniref:DNA repair protein RAD14 n=1 Tax=Hyaloscypha hepaticicola TaxID=2082293 RepID=A0A2J6PUT0_9HELO|nr:DNA repair protein [Hyaloscypha hepaticicola]
MERPSTPPRAAAPRKAVSPPTPEVTRRIEENRLKAKALRERSLAAEAAAAFQPAARTPSGFLETEDVSISSRKRTHASISTSSIPSTSRNAAEAQKEDGTQPARKFKKYVDHDFSKMTDTKGGFLSAEDDPWNKALHAAKEGEKPAHMTLKEWERHQLLKGLRNRKEGPFEPGLGFRERDKSKKCRECGSLEIDWQWEEVFKCAVCSRCKEKFPDRYSLLTKTEAKDDYLLTDPELKDEELLPHLNKPNPHKSHWHDMMLFLRYQVEEYAINKKWGSEEKMDAENNRREEAKKKRKEDKFKSKLEELKKKTRTEAYRRNLKGGKGGQFGDRIGGGRHEHEWGQTVENEDGTTVKTCTECGMEVEELEF